MHTEYKLGLEKKLLMICNNQNIKCTENMDIKAAKERDQIAYKERPLRTTPHFSVETLKARRARIDVSHTQKDHRYHPRQLRTAKLPIAIETDRQIFYSETNFQQFPI